MCHRPFTYCSVFLLVGFFFVFCFLLFHFRDPQKHKQALIVSVLAQVLIVRWLLLSSMSPGMQCYNKPGGLKDRKGEGRRRGKKNKKRSLKKGVRREWFFSHLFPGVLQQGFSLELPHFISCCAYLCVSMRARALGRVCVCALRACVNYVRVSLHCGDL